MVNSIQSSYGSGSAGVPIGNLNWTYWALNGVANSTKKDSYLCFVQTGPVALPKGSGSSTCGSSGPLPTPQ